MTGRRLLIGWLALVVWTATVVPASAEVAIRVSIKRLFDSAGNPPGTGLLCDAGDGTEGAAVDTIAKIEARMEFANAVLAEAHRGLFFDYEIVDLPTTPAPPADLTGFEACTNCNGVPWNLTHWSQFVGSGCNSCVLDLAARNDPAGLAYRPDAFNIYVTDVCSGGSAGTRSSNNSELRVVSIGQNVRGGPVRFAHELGHALNLCHTHGDGACRFRCPSSPSATGCAVLADLGDDCSADTRADANQCVGIDNLTQAHESMDYKDISSPELREEFLDTWFNVMSYHRDLDPPFWEGRDADFDCLAEGFDVTADCDFVGQDMVCPGEQPRRVCRYRLTPDQLDFATDRTIALYDLAAAGQFDLQPGIISGRSLFVDVNGNDTASGNSASPLLTLDEALSRTATTPTEEDVILLRGNATYDGTTLRGDTTGPVTIRATRGNARIE